MGERIYQVGSGDSDFIMFSEMDEEFRCLCTFPGNDQEKPDIDRIKALALFGAAVHLLMSGELYGPVFIPDSLPAWIVDAVRRIRLDPTGLPEEDDMEWDHFRMEE
jgi:hypothetical protein